MYAYIHASDSGILKTRKPSWDGRQENILIKSYTSTVGLLDVGACRYPCTTVYSYMGIE